MAGDVQAHTALGHLCRSRDCFGKSSGASRGIKPQLHDPVAAGSVFFTYFGGVDLLDMIIEKNPKSNSFLSSISLFFSSLFFT